MDLIAIRVIVEKDEECYMVLGIVHGKFVPVSGRFKDYIAAPKTNGYQSIHTTIEYTKDQKVEIQIRTKQMHEIAEEGVAAHWKYKEKKTKDKNEKYYQAVKKIIDGNFAHEVTGEVLNETIFVFTPKGDVMELDRDSTALDFAFQVHTQIGYRTIGAKVNDKIVPLDQKLENGDKVEILTSKATNGPGKDWINMVNNNSSKVKIKKWFKDLEFKNKVKEGQELLEEEFSKIGLKFKELEDDEIVYLYMKKYNISTIDNLYYKFATNSLNLNTFIQKFKPKNDDTDYENIVEEVIENANKYASKATNGPGKDWINMVNNNSSKVKIKKWFKDLEFKNKVKEGQELLEEEFSKIGLKFKELEDDEIVYLYMKKYNISTIDNLYYKFATNSLNLNTFIQKFKPKNDDTDYENIVEEVIENANKYASKK